MKFLLIILIINSLSLNANARIVRLPADGFIISLNREISEKASQVEVKIPRNLTTSKRLELIDLYLFLKVKAILNKPYNS